MNFPKPTKAHHSTRTRALWATPALLLFGLFEPDRADQAYEAGSYEEAQALYAERERESHRPSPSLLFNQALAALRAGDSLAAEIAAEKLVAFGGAEATREFILGNAAFLRCERVEAEAAATDAGPTVFDLAMLHAEQAREAWQKAVVLRRDWPEGRRNVERALLKIEALRKKRAESIEKRKAKDEQKKEAPKPEMEDPVEDENTDGDSRSEENPQSAIQTRLSQDEVMSLIDKLRDREREKAKSRLERRRRRNANVERDW